MNMASQCETRRFDKAPQFFYVKGRKGTWTGPDAVRMRNGRQLSVLMTRRRYSLWENRKLHGLDTDHGNM